MCSFAYRPCWSVLPLIAACILVLAPLPSLAQPATPLPKTFEQKVQLPAAKMSMDDVIAAISKQAHISILVDDEPLLMGADISFDGSLHDVLDKLADTFDYTWTLSKHGVVLMCKRFKNPDERPQMNLPEMLEMARGMVRALTMVDYNKDETQANDVVKRVAQTFTPEQTRAVQSATKLSGRDLLPAQKEPLQQAIFTRSFGPALKLWTEVIPRIENFKRSNLQAKPRTPTPPTHDYFYLYGGADGMSHAFEIQHIMYGENGVEIRTP